MAESTEVIQQQMEETRMRLAGNLEKLSSQTVGAVQEVAASVSETVGAVQETVQAVTDTVQQTVGGVQETVQAVSASVQQTVGGVQDFFDIPGQVKRHPWLVVGGSVAVGYVVGYLLSPPAGRSQPAPAPAPPAGNSATPAAAEDAARIRDYWKGPQEQAARPPERTWFDTLAEALGPTISRLQGLAVGAALGVARDVVSGPLSGQLGSQVVDVFDDLTRRLGGQPVQQMVRPPAEHSTTQPPPTKREKGETHEQHRAKVDRPMGAGSRKG